LLSLLLGRLGKTHSITSFSLHLKWRSWDKFCQDKFGNYIKEPGHDIGYFVYKRRAKQYWNQFFQLG
jgi:hypothetical protein